MDASLGNALALAPLWKQLLSPSCPGPAILAEHSVDNLSGLPWHLAVTPLAVFKVFSTFDF